MSIILKEEILDSLKKAYKKYSKDKIDGAIGIFDAFNTDMKVVKVKYLKGFLEVSLFDYITDKEIKAIVTERNVIRNGRSTLIEPPSNYLHFREALISINEFRRELEHWVTVGIDSEK